MADQGGLAGTGGSGEEHQAGALVAGVGEPVPEEAELGSAIDEGDTGHEIEERGGWMDADLGVDANES